MSQLEANLGQLEVNLSQPEANLSDFLFTIKVSEVLKCAKNVGKRMFKSILQFFTKVGFEKFQDDFKMASRWLKLAPN